MVFVQYIYINLLSSVLVSIQTSLVSVLHSTAIQRFFVACIRRQQKMYLRHLLTGVL